MELWVRSQDKENLVKVNRLDVSVLVENGELTKKGLIRNLYDNDEDFLGIYSTKERALEVLDEIQKLIKPTFKINYEYDDSQPIIDGEWLKSLKAESKIEELSCYVYEMPEE